MNSLDVVNQLRKDIESIVNQSINIMLTADADIKFQHRMKIKDLAHVANKISLISHGMVTKIYNAATDAAVGKAVTIRIQKTHKTSAPYIPAVDGDEMIYILRKRLQYLVRYEFELARKWVIQMRLPSNMHECMNTIDAYMLFAEELKLLPECDIQHTRAVQNACRQGNFSIININYHLRGM